MTLLDDIRVSGHGGATHGERDIEDDAARDDAIDLTEDHEREAARRASAHRRDRPLQADGIDPSGRITYRGMRIRRVRLKSAAKISLVFWLLAFAVIVGTVVVLWNVARALGLVESFEQTMITSLGLESFEVDGGGIFGVVVAGTGLLCLLGWLGTIAMAAVYNAACGVLGGLAVETGPLQRRRRVFSWRHRGFVTVTE